MGMYNEKEKIEVRQSIFLKAIQLLTNQRKKCTISSPDYIKRLKNYFIRNDVHEYDKKHAKMLRDETITSWEHYYDSLLQKKDVSNLKVAFLSGPNPENDIKVLINNGILEENIWAFENEDSAYSEAVENLVWLYPKAKIIKGKIDNFFANTPIKFDIIYLDFCGPIMSVKSKCIKTLNKMLEYHSLNSPGILITNFALPSEENSKEIFQALIKLASLYLYPKEFISETIQPGEWSMEQEEWYELIKSDFEYYYGEFITRFIMDYTSVFLPFTKLAGSDEYFRTFFKLSKKELSDSLKKIYYFDEEVLNREVTELDNDDTIEVHSMDELYDILNKKDNNVGRKKAVHKESNIYDDCGGHMYQEMNFYSIIWGLKSMDEKYGVMPEFFDAYFKRFAKSFLSQVCGERQVSDMKGELQVIDKVAVIYYMIFAGMDAHYSDKLKRIYNMNIENIAPQFCDVFTFQSIIGLLLGQVTVPYHINVKETKRWTYKAKETRMYTDMFVMDECRYIYDMMPTIDMIENILSDIDYQLCYRFALDGLNKNQFNYNNELFYGNAIVGRNIKGFEASVFSERKKVN